MSKKLYLKPKLEQVFYCGSREIDADSEVRGLRRDVNGNSIARDSYDDHQSNCGWGIVAGYVDGRPSLVPMRLREIDAMAPVPAGPAGPGGTGRVDGPQSEWCAGVWEYRSESA